MSSKRERLEVHKFAEAFLNGYTLDNKSKIFYPFIDRNTLPEVLVPFCNKRKTRFKAGEICKFLSEFYSNLGHESARKDVEVKLMADFSQWERIAKKKKDRKLKIVWHIKKYAEKSLKPYLYSLIMHGSFSTLDYTEWSDLDLLIIVKRSVYENPESIMKLRKKIIGLNRYLFLNDPLQHHGVFVIAEQELNYYFEGFLPTEVFKHSTALLGAKNIRFRTWDDREEQIRRLKALTEYIKNYENTRMSLYDWKLFCHIMLLLPLVYLQTNGTYVYKSRSFDLARRHFGKEWVAIDEMTNIRRCFSYNPKWHYMLTLILPNYWHTLLLTRLLVKHRNSQGIIQRSKKFAEVVEGKV